ncbi:MAG: hypothetical protein H7338_16100 [Candidatus Sericytochromatia bacterium]|nr:hypothetical protein [Candidatus Sericytochromatia bacterium]
MRILHCGPVLPSPEPADGRSYRADPESAAHKVIAVDAQTLTAIFGVRCMADILLAYARAYRIQVAHLPPGTATHADLRAGLQTLGIVMIDNCSTRRLPPDGPSPPCDPDPVEIPLLAMAAMALAHVHEQAGQTVRANACYQEVLRYDPADAHAHCGLARLADSGETARRHWRDAAAHVPITQTVETGRRFGLPGLSDAGANFAQDTASRWLAQISTDRAFEDIPDAVRLHSRYQWDAGLHAAQFLQAQGRSDLAGRCLKIELDHWPENAPALRLRGEMAFEQGNFGSAQADFDLADRLEA